MRWLKKLSVSLVALVLAVLAAEWYVGYAFPVLATEYRLDAGLLHTTIPGARRIQTMPAWAGGARNLVRINSAGYRGAELETPKARSRIVVLGDSLVMGGNVAENRTFPARLGAHLGRSYEVVNGGCDSYGPDQTLLRFERAVDDLAPDLAVLVLCATNDFGDLLRDKLFRIDERGELIREQPVLSDRIVEHFGAVRALAARPALVRLWIHFRKTRAAARREAEEARRPLVYDMNVFLQAATWEYTNAVTEQDQRVYNLRRDTYDADVAIHPQDPSSVYKRRLLTAVLTRLARTCSNRGIPLAAVVVPSAVDLDPAFHIRVDPSLFPTYDPRALTAGMATALEDADVANLSLFTLFAANDPTTLFVGRTDFHWNERGIELAARETARWLADQDLLP